MKLDLIVKNAKLVDPIEGICEVSIGIKDGKIAALFEGGAWLTAVEEIDARGQYVLPGLIEPHAHYTWAGPPEVLFATESASAAIGGMTTVITFYRAPVDVDPNEAIAGARELGEKHSHIDFSFHFAILTEGAATNLEHYVTNFGISSFKFYFAYKGEAAKQMGMVNDTDDGLMCEWFSRLAKFEKAVACIHCENVDIISRLEKKLVVQGRNDLPAWSEARPNFTEAEAVDRGLYFGEVTGCPVYIVHLSTKESLAEVAKRRLTNNRAYVETCPQYLTHTKDSPVGNLGKVNPPLRTQEDIEALWQSIANGNVNTIGSDNCGLRKEAKQGNIWQALPGFAGSATLLPVLLSEGVNKRGIPLTRIAEITSYNPARIFNLYPQKGIIRPGSDADLTIVDLEMEKTVTAKDLYSLSDFSIYEGYRLRGWPTMTMVRGEIVMREGKIVGKEGFGQFLKRNAFLLP